MAVEYAYMDSSSPIGITVPNWNLRHQLTVKMEESIPLGRTGLMLLMIAHMEPFRDRPIGDHQQMPQGGM